MEAALAVIADKGLDDTRMVDIGDAAGMSAGHVLYYFPSKAELLMQALKFSEDQFLSDALNAAKSMTTARDRFWRLVELSVPHTPTDPAWIIWLETWARAAHDQRVARFQLEIDTKWTSVLADVIREGQATGEFTDVDPDEFAVTLSALIDGLSIRLVGGGGAFSRERLLDICAEHLRALLFVS